MAFCRCKWTDGFYLLSNLKTVLNRFAYLDDFACALVIDKAERRIGKSWNMLRTVFQTSSHVVDRDVIDFVSKRILYCRKHPATRVIKTHIIQRAFAKLDPLRSRHAAPPEAAP